MKTWLTAFCCLITVALCAQTVTVDLSNSFKLKDRSGTTKEGSSFWYGNRFYCLETVNESGIHLVYTMTLAKIKFSCVLYEYDEQMNEVRSVKLDAPDHFGPFLPSAAAFDGKIYVFYYQMPDKSGVDLMYSVVDAVTLDASPGKKLGSIQEPNAWGFNSLKAMDENHLRIAVSPDSSKMLLAQIGNTPDVLSVILDKNGPIGKQKVSHFDEGNPKNFSVGQVQVTNAGDRLFTFRYWVDKHWQAGVLVQSEKGRDKWIDAGPMKDGLQAGSLFVYLSKTGDKIIIYGPCADDKFDRGVYLSTLDPAKMKLAPAQIFPYPPEAIMEMSKLDFVDKKHKDIAIKRMDFQCHELTDGSLVLSGYPVDVESSTYMKTWGVEQGMTTNTKYFAGPLLNVFIKDGRCAVGVVPRTQYLSAASDFTAIPYGNKLVCVYTDSEKSLGTDDLKVIGKQYAADQLVLAYAVINSDGTVEERKKLADRDGKYGFFTKYVQDMGNNSFLVPMCDLKLGFARYFFQMERWATVRVQ